MNELAGDMSLSDRSQRLTLKWAETRPILLERVTYAAMIVGTVHITVLVTRAEFNEPFGLSQDRLP